MTSSVGKIVHVFYETAGSNLKAAAPAGATSIQVENAADFNEAGGQISLPDGSVLTYLSADPVNDIIALSQPLLATLWTPVDDTAVDYFIAVYPTSSEMRAVVMFNDNDEGVQATVPLELQGYFSEGIRVPGTEEAVIADDEYGEWRITSVADEKTFSGAKVDPVGLPDPVAVDAPASTPELKVYGTSSALVVQVNGSVPQSTLFRYYISTDADFTPDATSLVNDTPTHQTVYTITALPATGSSTTIPLEIGTTYYVRAQATNSSGDAPASDDVPGALNADVLTEFIAAQIVAEFILTGRMQVGNITITPDGGIVIPQPDGGTITFPANGIDIAVITAALTAKSLNVESNLSINGAGQLNGILKIKSGITKPNIKPNVSYDWPWVGSYALGDLVKSSPSNKGMTKASTVAGTPGAVNNANAFVTAISFFGTALRFVDANAGNMSVFPDPTGGKAWATKFYPDGGIAYDSVREVYWLYGSDGNRNADWYFYAIDTTTMDKVYEFRSGVYGTHGAYEPRIDVNGSTLYMSYVNDSKQVIVNRYALGGTHAAPTLAYVNFLTAETISSRQPMRGLTVGTFDGTDLAFAYTFGDASNYIRIRKVSTPTANATGLGPFLRGGSSGVQGLMWHPSLNGGSGRFIHLSDTGKIYHYSSFKANTQVTAGNTWYDPLNNSGIWDESAGAGTHETDEGPVNTTGIQSRSWPSIESATPPDASDTSGAQYLARATRIYAAVSPNARTLQSTQGQSTRTQPVADTFADYWGDDTNYPNMVLRLRSTDWGKFDTFVQEDVGATISGTGIAAGTKITGVVSHSAGQAIYIDTPHTLPDGGNTTITIARSTVGRTIRRLNAFKAGVNPPPAGTNTFASDVSVPNTPGEISSTAADGSGSLVGIYGDGSWRLGNLSGDKTGKITDKGMQRGTSLITGTATATRSVAVSLDAAIFKGAAPSNVQVTPTGSWSDVAHVYVTSKSANGFLLGATHVHNATFSAVTPVTVDWVAWV